MGVRRTQILVINSKSRWLNSPGLHGATQPTSKEVNLLLRESRPEPRCRLGKDINEALNYRVTPQRATMTSAPHRLYVGILPTKPSPQHPRAEAFIMYFAYVPALRTSSTALAPPAGSARFLFLSPPPRGGGLDLVDRVPSNRRLQSPPGRTGSLARGSYNFRKRPLRRSRCEHGGVGFGPVGRGVYFFDEIDQRSSMFTVHV